MKKTTLLYVLTGAVALVVLVMWGGLTSFQWSLLSTVIAHLLLLWWRGWLVEKSTREIRRLREDFETYKRENEKHVAELAHRPIFPWDAHQTHQRA